jgi:predicted O-methyltransferase YrrM
MNKNKYIRSFLKTEHPILSEIEKANSTRNDIQPPVEFETAKLLSFLIRFSKAKNVLELGTSNGYSTIWLAGALKDTGGKIISIESKDRLYEEAIINIEKAGFKDSCKLIFGDAEVEAGKLIEQKEQFDLIFQDCGKYLYPKMLETTVKLLRKGGVIVADDTLFKVNDNVRENLGKHTDEYNRAVFSHPELYSTIIQIGHGLTVSLKIDNSPLAPLSRREGNNFH